MFIDRSEILTPPEKSTFLTAIFNIFVREFMGFFHKLTLCKILFQYHNE